MGIVRDSFVMFKNFVEAINALPEEYQLETYKAVMAYGLNGEMPQNLSSVANAMLISFSKGMENSIARYTASVENGKKGGAPKGNQNARKDTEQTELSTNQPKNNLETSKNNLNVNVNDNVNDELVKYNLNKFKSEYKISCGRVRERTMTERQIYLKYYQEYFYKGLIDPWKSLGYEVIDTMIEASEQAKSEGLKFGHKVLNNTELAHIFANVDVEQFRSIVIQIKFKEDINNRPYYIFGCIYNASQDKENRMTKEQMLQFIEDYEVKNECKIK